MIYTEEVLDRATGELKTIDIGDWITVTEFGELTGVGPRRVRTILRELDFVGVEGGGTYQRHRISSWAVRQGLGRRIEPKKNGARPFDVISPHGRKWLLERWAEALEKLAGRECRDHVAHAGAALKEFQVSRGREGMPIQEAVCWLSDHFPNLDQEDIAAILDVSHQLVSRYRNIQTKQRRERRCVVDIDGEGRTVGVSVSL